MPNQLDDLYERLLVLRCQAGDEAAFAELVQRYHARLRYFLAQLLADEHAAEDALQDVWLDVLRRAGQLRDHGEFRAWSYRMARDRRKIRTLAVLTVGLWLITALLIPGVYLPLGGKMKQNVERLRAPEHGGTPLTVQQVADSVAELAEHQWWVGAIILAFALSA